MAESFELDPVDWITAGAVGEPGRRTFYVQARRGSDLVAIVVEKGQVTALGQLAQELLGRIGIEVTPDDLDEDRMRLLEPVMPAWRAGSMSLGMDANGQRFLLEADELTEDEDVALEEGTSARRAGGNARFWLSRTQLVALAAYASYVVEAGARERCQLCSRPIDPVDGHVCPATNGHGPLTM
jgi:uncharacterized repeat protein (TIGR03847 family)